MQIRFVPVVFLLIFLFLSFDGIRSPKSFVFGKDEQRGCPNKSGNKKRKPKRRTKKASTIDVSQYADICSYVSPPSVLSSLEPNEKDGKIKTTTKTSSSKTTSTEKKAYPRMNAKDRKSHSALRLVAEVSGIQNLRLKNSPRLSAFCWMIHDDAAKIDARSDRRRFLSRYALVVLFFATHGDKWTISTGWPMENNSNNKKKNSSSKHLPKEGSRHECEWHGVSCARDWYGRNQVTKLELAFNGLNGILPRELSLLKDLQVLDLDGNDVQGVLPHAILAEMKNLEVVALHMNNVIGQIPREIGKMKNLRELHLFGNYLEGSVPKEIGTLENLEVIDLSFTYLDGKLPSDLANAKNLREIYLHDTALDGHIPNSLCKLRNLEVLQADCLGPNPEVTCDCCTVCCGWTPKPKCVNVTRDREG